MRVIESHLGGLTPFEGDLTLQWNGLPAGARATAAKVTCSPATYPGGTKFEETFVFGNDSTSSSPDANTLSAAVWGISKAPVSPGAFAEVDFHARRTLARVRAAVTTTTTGTTNRPSATSTGTTSAPTASLQVDLGGMYVEVNAQGAVKAPGDQLLDVTCDGNDQVLPGLTVARFKLTLHAAATGTAPAGPPVAVTTGPAPVVTLDIDRVTIRSVPTNISVRLGTSPPFWRRTGDLAVPDTSPDFAAQLNAFLAGLEAQNGFYQIPIVIHSDTIARLDVTLTIGYVVEQAVLPPHLSQVTIPYDFSTLPTVDPALVPPALPRAAVPVAGRTTARIRGAFQPTRVAHEPLRNGDLRTVEAVVSPGSVLAQALQSPTEIAVTGIDLPLSQASPPSTYTTVTGVAVPRSPVELQQVLSGLVVSIRADAGGKPFGDVLASAGLRVEKLVPGQSAWGSATLPSPFRVLHGVRYWLMLQSANGQVSWIVATGSTSELPLQASQDGGLSWHIASVPGAAGPLAALFRLRNTPATFSVPVELKIGAGSSSVLRTLSEFNPLGRVDFSFDFADKLADYLATQAPASPCGSGELLSNGDFAQPPHDDATGRLFGVYQSSRTGRGNIDQITGRVNLRRGVDLRVQRYIALAVGDVSPQTIDCSGPTPAQTQVDDIVAAINRFTAKTAITASTIDPGFLRLSTEAGADIQLARSCRRLVPRGWTGTAGQVYRIQIPQQDGTEQLYVVLAQQAALTQGVSIGKIRIQANCFDAASIARPSAMLACGTELSGGVGTALSQRVQVAADCRYRFTITYLAGVEPGTVPPSDTFPGWEVAWLDANGAGIATESGVLNLAPVSEQAPVPSIAEQYLTAPQGAVEANLSIRHKSSDVYPLVLIGASFMPTVQTLSNASFRQWTLDPGSQTIQSTSMAGSASTLPVRDSGTPDGWTSSGGTVYRLITQVNGNSTIIAGLLGDGPDDTVLSQIATVTAGAGYELNARAWALLLPPDNATAQPLQQRPRLELHWQDGVSPGEPLVVPVDTHAFSTRAWSGVAPTGAKQVELRIIQPRGNGTLLIESVSLVATDSVAVPLTFVAKTPGELTIADLRVAYDVPSPPPAASISTDSASLLLQALVESGTPAPQKPAGAPPVSPAAAPAMPPESPPEAPPSGGHTEDVVTGAPPTTAVESTAPGAPPAAEVEETAPEAPPAAVQPAPEHIEAAQPPAEATAAARSAAPRTFAGVEGIGPKYTNRLIGDGIDSPEKLAAASPEVVARVLGVSEKRAGIFIAAAQKLLAPEKSSEAQGSDRMEE